MTLLSLAQTCAQLQADYQANKSDDIRRIFNTAWEAAMELTTHIEFFIMVCEEVNRLENK